MTRKKFLESIVWLTALPYLLFVALMVRKQRQVSASKIIRVQMPASSGISFYDEVIIIKAEDFIYVFAAKCTHLGCLINRVEEGNLLCPCHGSTFSMDGKVNKGPASKSLENLPYTVDKETDEIVIKL